MKHKQKKDNETMMKTFNHNHLLMGGVSISMLVSISMSVDAQGLRDRRGDRLDDRRGTMNEASDATPVAIQPAPAAADAQPASASMTVAIPQGARAIIRISAALDSSRHAKGHRFSSTLQSDIVSGSTLIAAKGSQVQGQVADARQPRNVAGQSFLELKITGLTVGSQIRPIESSLVKVESARTGADTLKKTAGGAAIGGLADDEEGAEAGAKIGGAASLVSKGQTAVVAKGTVLEFAIGAPGSGIGNLKAETVTQPQEGSTDRIRGRRDDRSRRRR